MMSIKGRSLYLCVSGFLLLFLVASSFAVQAASEDKDDLFQAFIVSDAHFGWRHPMQPDNNRISHAMGDILTRFPNLDVFLDTGDIHHGNSYDVGRQEWTDILQSGIGLLPFYVAAGNHEIVAYGRGRDWPDIEQRVCSMISASCRPYFSFDMEGIHVVCLPELITANLVTEESLAWLALDLDLNRDKTTIIATHNSIEGTTLSHDSKVYRRVANSERMLEFLSDYPNVVAWMHGHNHTWELVKKGDRFYVSNGRIGGFSPPYDGNFGRGRLGGIYLEVGPDHFTVRGYSATEHCFLDEIEGYDHMSQTMKLDTSFDPSAEPAHSYGYGGARDGMRIPVYQHHLLGEDGQGELFLAAAPGPVFSENSALAIFAEEEKGWSRKRITPAVDFSPNRDIGDEIGGVVFLDPGMRLLPYDNPDVVRHVTTPPGGAGRAAYYRCAPGRSYQATLQVKSEESGPQCSLVAKVHDRNADQVYLQKGDPTVLTGKKQEIVLNIDVPSLDGVTSIYSDRSSDNVFHIMVDAEISDMDCAVDVLGFEIQMADAESRTRDAAVIIDNQRYEKKGVLRKGKPVRFDLPESPYNRSVVEVEAGGNRRLTWLVRQKGLAWQVRNAPVALQPDGSLEIGPVRNPFSTMNEIIFAPMSEPEGMYVSKMRNINKCRIYPYDPETKELVIDVQEMSDEYADVEILNCPHGPSGFENAGHRLYHPYRNNRVGVQVEGPGKLVVKF